MRIRRITISWFRGAAASVTLEAQARSIVIYGPNGAGKSCFVDALEYVLRNGRIQHLAHEYSGRHQERAVLNTHRPEDCAGKIEIRFADGADLIVTIAANGVHSLSGVGANHVTGWDCARTVLRQDEVSRFIHSTKGEKYSVLLPLLGLAHLETAAENLRQLSSAVSKQSGMREAAAGVRAARSQFESYFGKGTTLSGEAALEALCAESVHPPHDHSTLDCGVLVEQAIDRRLADATESQRMQVAIEQLAQLNIRSGVKAVRAAAAALARSADQMVQAELEVLRATNNYLIAVGAEASVHCPACGRIVPRSEIYEHVQRETQRLDSVIAASNEYRRHCRALTELVGRAGRLCQSKEVLDWSSLQPEHVRIQVDRVSRLSVLPDTINEDQLDEIETVAIPVVVAAASAAAFLPPPAAELARAKEKLLAARNLLVAESARAESAKGEELALEIRAREASVREQIRTQSEEVIRSISDDIQRMWRKLHPGEPIEDVRLKVPEEADKAIDIALKFYGKELESPRLTLSEGYRNSLGLCVFLSMAARISDDTPIVLDDVVVSLDRGHRGMVAELIKSEFPQRQVILLTHDRDWYSELRLQLAGSEWQFQALLPYRSPEFGIAWSGRSGAFGDAREYLKDRPDTASNEARKVMDVELAKHAERIGLELPFVRGDKNDKRGAHEFLRQLISRGGSAYKRKDSASGRYEANATAIAAFERADRLMISWGNRGSHSEDVVKIEAEQLIAACEDALAALKCDGCQRYVTYAEITADGSMQCQCGQLRWRK